MTVKKVAVIGGGPAGLYAARLIRTRRPDWRVALYERTHYAGTFGFGVGLTGHALALFRRADTETHQAILGVGVSTPSAEFWLPGGRATIPGFSRGLAVARVDLLRILLEACESVGVVLKTGVTAEVAELSAEYDIVVVADGASSASRATLGEELGAAETFTRNAYIWCAADVPLDCAVFAPVQTKHGVFATHSYPFTPTRSGHVIEASAEAIRRAGMTIGPRADGSSDQAALDYLSGAFTEVLKGHPLIGNRSAWGSFRWVDCERWHAGNVVVIGDAAATAHPSLGSGTKLAMQSAIALAGALVKHDSFADAAAEYERTQRPATGHLQDRARRSQLWWESIDRRLDLRPSTLALSYLTRAGAMSLAKVDGSASQLITDAASEVLGRRAEGADTAELSSLLLREPLTVRNQTIGSRRVTVEADGTSPGQPLRRCGARDVEALRQADPESVLLVGLTVNVSDPWGREATEIVEQAGRARAVGADGAYLQGGPGRLALLDRLALGERIRREQQAVVAVSGPREFASDLLEGLLCQRLDLIDIGRE